MELSKGANTGLPSGPVTVQVAWNGLAGTVQDVDVSAFLLTESGRVRTDDDMIFYGQPAAADGSVRAEALSQNGATRFAIDPSRLGPDVARVAICATLTSTGIRPFSDVAGLTVTVMAGGAAVATYTVETSAASEAALILAEVYRRNDAWKFRAVGQGFNGGLKPLAENYGVSVEEPAASVPPPPPPPPAPSVNLSKISLSKSNPTISLEKKAGGLGQIDVNLNWNQRQTEKKGFFGVKKSGGIDLDLCCLYELADGSKLGVQALGGNFGQFESPPFIELAGDDRTGAVSGGEWMRINGDKWDKIKRILIFAMIYEGVPNWSATDGVATLYAPGNPDIEVRLEGESKDSICAVALLENVRGALKISRENLYFSSARAMDDHYDWKLSWTSGRK